MTVLREKPARAGDVRARGTMLRNLANISIPVVTAVLSCGPLQAQGATTFAGLTDEQAAIIFGARENILQVSLSPDGSKIATLEPNGARGTIVRVRDAADPEAKAVAVLTASGDPERIGWCRWSGLTRLMCGAHAVSRLDGWQLATVSRLMAVNADGSDLQLMRLPGGGGDRLNYSLFGGGVIDWNTGKDGHVLMVRRYVPEAETGRGVVQRLDGLAVDDVDTAKLSASRVEWPKKEAQQYISDGHGHVRIMGIDPKATSEGYSSATTRYLYRTPDSEDWKTLSHFDAQTGAGFDPYFVDPTLNLAYGLKKIDGRYAAVSVSLDGQAREATLLARSDVDVDGFATIGRNRRVVGMTFSTDRREVSYFDAELKRLHTSLAKGLKDLPLIRFVDSSQDESKLLIWAGSDVDAGHYYLLDRGNRGLAELMVTRQPLADRPLAPVRSITIKAADGTDVPAYLTVPLNSDGKKLPAIVMPHGGPSARDEWGFDWLAQFWASRGYAVLQPNFRGSAGYGDAWFQGNGFQSWRTAIGDIADSGRWLVSQGIADPAKLAIFGWSYGGYAALQSAAVEPDLFKAVVAIAPVTDLGQLKQEAQNWSSYRLQRDFIGSGPHIEEGSPARQAGKIKAPVLIFHGNFDRNVNIRQSQLMADRLKNAGKAGRLVTYDKLDHYLEDSDVRKDMLLQSATFLRESFAAAR